MLRYTFNKLMEVSDLKKHKNGAEEKITTPFIPLGTFIVTEDLLQKAKKELNETEDNVKDGLKQMKDLVLSNKLHCSTDTEFLMRFLRGKKFNVKASFDSLKHFVHGIKVAHEKFGDLNKETVTKLLQTNICGLLPYKDSEGRAIIFYKTGLVLQQGFTVIDAIQTIIVIAYYLMQDPATQISGFAIIANMSHLSFREAYFMEHVKTMILLLRGFPGRFQRVDIVHECFNAKLLVSIIKPFLPKKLQQRILFHGHDKDSLLRFYDERILPVEYGGIVVFDNAHWLDKVDSISQMLKMETIRYQNHQDPDFCSQKDSKH